MSSAANISPRRTRAKNADTHPGHAVLQTTRRKRRTKDEIARDNQRIQEELEAKEAAALQGIQRLANIEAGMEQMKASVATRKPTAIRPSTRPRPVPVKKKLPVASQEEIYLAEDRASRVDDQVVAAKSAQDRLNQLICMSRILKNSPWTWISLGTICALMRRSKLQGRRCRRLSNHH
jgi:hypothetical protein